MPYHNETHYKHYHCNTELMRVKFQCFFSFDEQYLLFNPFEADGKKIQEFFLGNECPEQVHYVS